MFTSQTLNTRPKAGGTNANSLDGTLTLSLCQLLMHALDPPYRHNEIRRFPQCRKPPYFCLCKNVGRLFSQPVVGKRVYPRELHPDRIR